MSKLTENATHELKKVEQWWNKVMCEMPKEMQSVASQYLLAGIFLKLNELTEAIAFGSKFFRITQYQLTSSAQRIVQKDPNGTVRKVSVWTDSAVGGPTPTVRVSSDGTPNTGVRLAIASVNELGELPHNQELWASAVGANLTVYVVERA